jgi:excisionase family DNA binding protein
MPEHHPEPIALSPGGTARFLSLSRRVVYDLLASGQLTARKSGGRTLVDFASIKAYYARCSPVVISARTTPRKRRAVRS